MARPVRIRRRGPGDGGFGGGGFGGGSFGSVGFDFSLSPWVKRLLIANAAVFLLMALGVLPARWAVRTLGFAPADFLHHPWSPLTYMFVHGGFWHLFLNMVGVFFFGPPLERTWGSDFFIRYYLVAGLGAALFSVFMIPVIGAQPVVIGASGALYGLLLAFALLWPNALIYIWGVLPIKAKWFVGAFGLLALWGTVSGAEGGVAHWAHLGGLVTGFLFLRFNDRVAWALGRAKRGLEESFFRRPRGRASGRMRVMGGDRKKKRGTKPRGRRGGRAGRKEEPEARPRDRRGVSGATLDRVDTILDKIREEGIDALSEEERSFLDEVSRKYQGTK